MYENIIQKIEKIEQILLNKQENKWHNIKQVCHYTSLSESTLRRAITKGQLRCSNQTGKLLFRLSWVDTYLGGIS